MDAARFDSLARTLADMATSRRTALAGLAAWSLAAGPGPVSAKKRKKKVRFNAFGCVNVGRFCKNDGQCCSGVCEGKKGRRRCRNHDAGAGCRVGDHEDSCGGAANIPCTTATGFADGVCDTTTGNAPYCVHGFDCADCRTDADCRERCGPQAACIKCPACGGFQTACVGPSPGDCS